MRAPHLGLPGGKLKTLWGLMRETYVEWDHDNAMQLAAMLAFYTVFSFAPILIILVATASSVFGTEAARTEVVELLQGVLGRSGAIMVQTVLQDARPASFTNVRRSIPLIATPPPNHRPDAGPGPPP